MDIQGPKRTSKARERHLSRKQRRSERMANRPTKRESAPIEGWRGQLVLRVQDFLWYIRNRQWVWQVAIVVTVMLLGMMYLTYVVSGRIYPNVAAMGVEIGGMSVTEAEELLRETWLEMEVPVVAEGAITGTIRPQELGFQFDAAATAQAAREVGWRDGFAGITVKPVVTLPDSGFLLVQDYLLNMTDDINEAPYNAGFQWQGDNLVTVEGRAGRLLDIAPTLAAIQEDPASIVENQQLTVFVSPVPPDIRDSSLYLETARQFTSEPFAMIGYDPYRDEEVRWSTDKETFTSWIEVNISGLTLREEAFASFIELQNDSLNPNNEGARYLNVEETMSAMREAIANQQSEITLRVRYNPQDYVVEAGDTASKIARKTGIPFYLIQQHNPGRDLDILSVGDTLNMPTRDVTMPHTPVANKRIVVDLEQQEMWAFENDELVFNWRISSGRSAAPTSPGIYQILDHSEKAYGSSFTLCDDIGCGQWEMSWFMGIYEVVPGLVNGFHGAVLLPNGAYLNGGDVGYPSTFGCVMSEDGNAKLLYDWAEQGTVVEIVSREFEPLSDLAAQTQSA